MICLHSGYLGTDKHLLVGSGGDELSWVSECPSNIWTWGFETSSMRIEDVTRMFRCDPDPLVPESHRQSAGLIWGESVENIPWKSLLPTRLYSSRLTVLLERLQEACQALQDSGYGIPFRSFSGLVEMLSEARVDKDLWGRYLTEELNPTNRSALRTFSPNSRGFAQIPTYDFMHTSTGRAIVRDGPRILTLPAAYRDILVPSSPENVIVQIDFVSLEPRVALCVLGKDSVEADVYRYVAENAFERNIPRRQIKIATLCALYGASSAKLQKMMPGENVIRIINNIKEFFGIKSLISRLRRELKENQFLQNHFGRPLFFDDGVGDNVLYSHFIQSTSVDISVMGFCNFIQQVKDQNMSIRPLFVLHDALICEFSRENVSAIAQICAKGIPVGDLGIFPLELDKLSM